MPVVEDSLTGAAGVAEWVHRSRRRFFRREDFAGSRTAIEKALSRHVESGELLRVRNGLYWKGPLTAFGMAPPNPREIAKAYAGPYPTGPAGISAANALGLTTQVPRVSFYAVPADVPDIDRIRLVRHNTKRATARRSADLGEHEVALLEVLDAWERVVELDRDVAKTRLVEMIRKGELDAHRVALGVIHEPARVRVRLGALLESAGHPDLADLVPPASSKATADNALAVFAA